MLPAGLQLGRRTVRIGVTGLARSGKTTLLTSIAANLIAHGAGLPALPALTARLGARQMRVALAQNGVAAMPRFDHLAHLAALANDPPRWPSRTGAASLLSLDLEIDRTGLAAALPPRQIRLELLDYPGEWLLDLPLQGQTFADWSAATLERLGRNPAAALARDFLDFVRSLPDDGAVDESLIRHGVARYVALLKALRDEMGLALLQPGRFLMPAPGAVPDWMQFFPLPGASRLAAMMAERFEAYCQAVRDDLVSPAFGRVDRLVVLADILSALHAGPAAFADMAGALGLVAEALRQRRSTVDFPQWLSDWVPDWVPGWIAGLTAALTGISRTAFVATKCDHVAQRQRGNLARLVSSLTGADGRTASFAVAAVRCTEDIAWTLDGRTISAVRGRVLGSERPLRSYPGEVPDHAPDKAFWQYPFLSLPTFEPARVPLNGRGGVSHIGIDNLLVFLLEDLL